MYMSGNDMMTAAESELEIIKKRKFQYKIAFDMGIPINLFKLKESLISCYLAHYTPIL